MRLSNKSTFSLACLVLLFAFATVPAMADSMSAVWSADLDATTENAQPGWNVTLTVVTAPGVGNQPSITSTTDATVKNRLPATSAVVAATKVFTFSVQLTDVLADSDVTVTGRRRVTLTNGRDLGSTSIYEPKLKKITAPKSAQAVLTVTIEFESPAAAVAAVATPATPAVLGIGPAIGLRVADIMVTDSQVISLSGGPNTYTVQIILSSGDSPSKNITLAATFPSQDPTLPAGLMATVIRDVERPSIGEIGIATRGNDRVPAALVGWSTAFDVTVDKIMDTPDEASTFDLASVKFTVTPVTKGATVTNVGVTSDGIRIAQITPKVNSSTDDWDATTITITVTATDLAGNTSIKSIDVLLAARAKSGPTKGPGDQLKPTLSMIPNPTTLEEDDTVIFTITFSEPVVSFTVGHLVVTNGGTPTAADLTTTDNKVFKLKVTPFNADFPVKVEVAPNTQVSDAAGNKSAALTGSGTYTPAGVLGVEIDQPVTTSPDSTLRFKFTFGALTAKTGAGAFTISDITASNAEALTDADLQQSVSDTMVYWLTVTPMDSTNPVEVQLNADAVSDDPIGDAKKLVAGQVSATFTPADTDPIAASDDGVIIVPANGFVVVVRDPDVSKPGAGGLDFPSGVGTDRWVDMPDLQELFDKNAPGGGGALILRRTSDQAALSSGTVGISEVMWGIDLGHLGNETRQIASQWIELHNLNSTDVKVQLSAKTGRAITSDTAIIGNLSDPIIDVMTNFFNNRPGATVWNVPGTSGNSVSGGDFKAMARILPSDNKAFDLGRKKDGQYIGRYTNTGGANKSRDGRASSSWTAATSAYDTLRTTRTDVTNTLYNFVGTPGKVNTFKPTAQPHIKDARRNVPANPIIFNEIANLSNPDHEWIELRNVTSGKVNLRNYLISVVTSDSSDAVLYQFPNNNSAQVDANGVFLLVTSDPRDKPDHPLAVGWNVDIKKEDQIVGLGDNPPEYKVTPFAGDGLPDDGKFVLILRKPDNHEGHRSGAHGSKGVAETKTGDLDKVVDIAGWSDNVSKSAYSNPVSSTGIWPLRAMGGIGGFTNNKLEVNKVHYRRNVGTNDGRAGAGGVENKNDKSAFTDVGYNGVGYKRQAARSNANGGSPGYHNNLKGKLGDLADNAKVVISEIMLTQGGGRSVLPQWIELHNTSKTQAVNLADDQGWRLVIETPGDPIRTINFKDKGSVKTILPNQTVLIVSAAARSFGSTHLPALTTFPATRVFDVYRELRTHFEMENRTSPFLNPKAFHISLWDGKSKDGDYIGEMSDVIGNLDGNARTNDKAAWEFPESITEGGYRSSLIRIFDKGEPRNGVSMDADIVKPLGGAGGVGVDGLPGVDPKYSWVHAADTGFNSNRFVRHTWYGDENDRATPIDRAGQVLPVSLSYFRPTLENGEIVIRWTTESELDNAGFNILRSDSQSGEFKQVNSELVQGAGTTGERNTYKWVDETAKLGVVYYYQIEDVSFAGEHQTLTTTKLKGLISAGNKRTLIWGELKEVQ